MMFKFVAADAGTSNKRHQTSRACDSCRRRKKRCYHNVDSGSIPHASRTRNGLSRGRTGSPSSPTQADTASQTPNIGEERRPDQTQYQSTIQVPSEQEPRSSRAREETPRGLETSNESQVSHIASQDSGHSRFIGCVHCPLDLAHYPRETRPETCSQGSQFFSYQGLL
jgi:hypothetical protein